MKGKIGFVLGAAVGYVLGTRAGRERYEQIKRGAKALWGSEPVQRGVHVVSDAADERVGELKNYAKKLFGDALARFLKESERAGAAPGGPGTEHGADQPSAGEAGAGGPAAAAPAAAAGDAAGAAAPGTKKPGRA